jgi:hypothetical protein
MKDDYPLYIKWRYIVAYMLDISGKFPKNVRFNLADRLTNISLDVLEAIIEAIYAKSEPVYRKDTGIIADKCR